MSPFPVSVANTCQAIGMVPVHGGRTRAPGGRKFPEAGSRACREESRAHEDTAGCSPMSPGLWALDESCIPKHEPFSSPQSTSGQQAPWNSTQIQALPDSHLGVYRASVWMVNGVGSAVLKPLPVLQFSVLLAWETNSQKPKLLHPG